jgi:hypothetical protein
MKKRCRRAGACGATRASYQALDADPQAHGLSRRRGPKVGAARHALDQQLLAATHRSARCTAQLVERDGVGRALEGLAERPAERDEGVARERGRGRLSMALGAPGLDGANERGELLVEAARERGVLEAAKGELRARQQLEHLRRPGGEQGCEEGEMRIQRAKGESRRHVSGPPE